MESWKTFRKTDRAEWQVSTLGRIKKNGELYTPYVRGGRKGNRYLCLSLNTPYGGYIHRIVANTFIPNPKNKKTVNHIDGDKTNNAVSNLEWASYAENNNHALEIGLRLCMDPEEVTRRENIRRNNRIKENEEKRKAELKRRNKIVLQAREVFKDRKSNTRYWDHILLEVALWLKERDVKLRYEHVCTILPNLDHTKWGISIKRDMKKVNASMKQK